jgi:hypothetical protein
LYIAPTVLTNFTTTCDLPFQSRTSLLTKLRNKLDLKKNRATQTNFTTMAAIANPTLDVLPALFDKHPKPEGKTFG